ncbi:hypothetical protein [Nonomuraea dietziae]|uniref:hypothetical protein n=1 Tax=Nonomuraea dietziae TaxID=65515 RepID=UPI003414B0A3
MSKANELIGAAMEALAREDQAAFDSAAAFLADRDDADRVLVEVVTRAISGLWRNGSQPADVVRLWHLGAGLRGAALHRQPRRDGATKVVKPACPRCGGVKALSKSLEGQRVCQNCFARSAAACSRCGAVREPAT